MTHNLERLRNALVNIGVACVVGGLAQAVFARGSLVGAIWVTALGIVLIYASICERRPT